jgi:hypothetical protein
MHSAPAVSYPVVRSAFEGALLAGTWLIGGLAVAVWMYQMQQVSALQSSTLMGISLATGAWAAWRWWHVATGSLEWDGEGWHRGGPQAASGQVHVALDLQGFLLLRWRAEIPGPDTNWIWLERSAAPSRWNDLRRAVYSRAHPEAMTRAEPSAPKP